MQPEKLAVAWGLLLLVGALLGLVVLVAAFGVARHLRRQRGRPPERDARSSRGGGPDRTGEDEDDAPTSWQRTGGHEE